MTLKPALQMALDIDYLPAPQKLILLQASEVVDHRGRMGADMLGILCERTGMTQKQFDDALEKLRYKGLFRHTVQGLRNTPVVEFSPLYVSPKELQHNGA